MLEIPDVEHLPRKAAGTEWNWPKREPMCAAGIRVTGAGLPKSTEGHIMPLDAGHGVWWFK